MSDDADAPDPIDKAYLEAEAVLSDDEARATRRARVLAAVTREAAPAALPSPARRRPDWRRGGWLAAACVVGLGVFLVSQISQPVRYGPQTAASPAAPAQTIRQPETGRMTAPSSPAAPPSPARRGPSPSRIAAGAPALAVPPIAPAAADEAAFPPPPPPPPPPAVAESGASTQVQVTGSRVERRASSPAVVKAFAAPAPAPPSRLDSSASPGPDPASRLRAAAAAGLTAEAQALLDQGAPVDAADAEGDTALMKSIRAGHSAVAALLRSRGASLDRRNRAGESARDLAAAKDDVQLNRALGLRP